MKPITPRPDRKNPQPRARRLRITSVHCRYSAAMVGFEIHDESESVQKVVSRLMTKNDLGDAYEVDSTSLDVWVTPK